MDVINEKNEAIKILKYGGLYKNSFHTINLLAKHFYLTEGMSKKDTVTAIDIFMKKNYGNYNVVDTPIYIESRVNSYWSDKTDYVEVDCVGVALSELEHIRKLDNVILEKILFVILVDAKINMIITQGESNGWTKTQLDDLLKDAKVHGTYERKFLQTHQIFKVANVRYTKDVEGSGMKVGFINCDDSPVIELTDMRNYVYEYLKWRGEHIDTCVECGTRMLGYNTKKYCKECAKSVKRRNDRERAAKK